MEMVRPPPAGFKKCSAFDVGVGVGVGRCPNPVQNESVTILSTQSIRARGGASAVVISLDNLQKVIAACDVPAFCFAHTCIQGKAAGPIF